MDDVPRELRPIVAIHQPNFFPWLGYFHKMRWSDAFVLLDDAQIQKTGGSVTNRTELVSSGRRSFFTAPIDRTRSGTLRIDQVRFAPRGDFRERLVATLKQSYQKARHMQDLGEEIFALVRTPTESLAEYNAAAIRALSDLLRLPARVTSSSALDVSTTSTARLVEIAQKLGGRTYLCGSGARDYQDDAMFLTRGIHVWYRDFEPPAYARGSAPPERGLSVLDALFHLGRDGTRALLERPLDPARLARAEGRG